MIVSRDDKNSVSRFFFPGNEHFFVHPGYPCPLADGVIPKSLMLTDGFGRFEVDDRARLGWKV